MSAVTTDILGEKVLLAFKLNDYEKFKSLFITESNYDFILKKMEVSDSLKVEYKKRGMGAINFLLNQSKDNFEKIRETAISNGVVWENVELLDVKTNSRNKGNIERADVAVLVQSGGINFVLSFGNCYKSDVWHLMDRVDFQIKEETR